MSCPLDPETPVAVASTGRTIFDDLVASAPGGVGVLEGLHQRELEAAARPPVINVTVTDPEGFIAPGHWRIHTGPQPAVVYHEEPAPDVIAGPLLLTREAQEQLGYQFRPVPLTQEEGEGQ